MAEPIFLRVRRVLSASAEETVDAMERAGAGSVMREAIRQIDRAIDDVRAEHRSAQQRGVQAKKLEQAIRDRIADLDEKARFALGKGREDLAEAALSSQLDLEERVTQLETAQKESAEQVIRLDSCFADLRARKTKMEKELRDFEARRRDCSLGGGDRDCSDVIERRVERAEATFERVKSANGDPEIHGSDPEDMEKLAEIESIRRSSVVAERLEALRAAPSPASSRRRSRS